jgi:RNHCP domain
MSRKQENAGFVCERCGRAVAPLTNGSYRNHCPFCLFSKHVDVRPGDRSESCNGMMEAIGLVYHSQKGYQIIHRCLRCRAVKVNKVAEYTVQPDEIEQLVKLIINGTGTYCTS